MSPLTKLKETGKKIVITGQINAAPHEIGDIKVIPIIDFLLDQNSLE